ncbi:hypothetical protein CSC04_1380 [Enterobacter roggenkampii]|uniref:hypothetical protein n=1 Tax=Enterobacter roggenkampii TaxID=1812935 RepID=UPI00064A0DCE|nr:hypothetical protein [Enterobacter roggenkampii]AOP83828.1 hypothetical protein BFV66_17985 [Enterobacter hormaechei subsp. oharae]AVE71884.1 hypothetical protein AM439_05345 [Enterobacter cloacae complex sp.]AZL64775.1 hypothetical protein EI562_18315 [Enterobacter asburiae]CZW61056.1 Uncharacterised protein [Enterobacter hormaechei]KLP25435.1 hypothetical protein YA48_23115 [Enterobacter roggenkampii]
MYVSKQDVLTALHSGALREAVCASYTRNKNLSEERRKMFKVALIQYRIDKLRAILREEEKTN